LPAQRFLPLLGDEALLGVTDIAQDHLESGPIELAVRGLQLRIRSNMVRDLGIGEPKTHLPRTLVEAGPRNHFTEHLPVHAESACTVCRQRLTELAAKLLQAILVSLPEAFDRDFGIANLGEARAAEAAKNVVDPPNGKAAGQHRHDDTHDTAAKPIFRGFSNTPEHATNFAVSR